MRPGPLSLAPLGPPPIAGGRKDTPSTPALTGHPHVQLDLLQHLQDATLLHTALFFMTQNLLSKVFSPATSTLPPPLAFPVLLFLLSFLLPFQLALFFFPHLIFNSLTSSLP